MCYYVIDVNRFNRPTFDQITRRGRKVNSTYPLYRQPTVIIG